VSVPEIDRRTKAFFDGSDQLRTIFQWARARYAAPWAVLVAVLLRVIANTEPNVQLPAVIGGRASLNLFGAFVGISGAGKGTSDAVAALAYPCRVGVFPPGSGEGIAALFTPDKDGHILDRAILSAPEVDKLAGLFARQGTILGAELKAVAMGEQIGQQNAKKDTTRIVAAHSYRLCMSVGVQPENSGALLADTSGGTPQRFIWVPVTDPSMPREAPSTPEPLDTHLPVWEADDHGVVELVYGPSEIRELIIDTHLAKQRGELADPLAGHTILTRCKLAAALALLHKRTVINADDWQRAGTLIELSDRTRQMVVDTLAAADRQRNTARALAVADREQIISDRRAQRARQTILRKLDTRGQQTKNQLRMAMKADIRDYLDSAISDLLDTREITVSPVQRGTRKVHMYHRYIRQKPVPSSADEACTTSTYVPPPIELVPNRPTLHRRRERNKNRPAQQTGESA
jgi:hypothetical protein